MSRFVVGLTGGIASGKSALTREFEALGVTVVDADVVAREVVEPGPVLSTIAERFGTHVLQPDGRLDRRALRELVFADEALRLALEVITHPAIRERLHQRCLAAEGPYVIAAIPLLTEAGGRGVYSWLDRIVVVDTPVEVQHARLMQRDGISTELADRMIAAQATRAQRLAIADDVVVNDGKVESLAASAETLDRRYRALSASKP